MLQSNKSGFIFLCIQIWYLTNSSPVIVMIFKTTHIYRINGGSLLQSVREITHKKIMRLDGHFTQNGYILPTCASFAREQGLPLEPFIGILKIKKR